MRSFYGLLTLGIVVACTGCTTDKELLDLGYRKSLHKHIGDPVDGVCVCVWPDGEYEGHPRVRVDVIVVGEGIGLVGEPPIGFALEVDGETHGPEGVAFSFLSGAPPVRGGVYGIPVVLNPEKFRKARDVLGDWGPGEHHFRIVLTLQHPDGGPYKNVYSKPFDIKVEEMVNKKV